jgi:hypothetical protein
MVARDGLFSIRYGMQLHRLKNAFVTKAFTE